MRETTERPEGLATGMVRLVGTDSQTITKHASLFLENHSGPPQRSWKASPYGDGHAAERIAQVCGEFLARQKARTPGA
jgi:UDP-N-acetylglucosamine 2-epimerase (non-hydrolysing)